MRKSTIACLLFAAGLLTGGLSDAAFAQKARATFAGGCFWCMEPPFDGLEGVVSTTSGYTGGDVEDPTYERVSAGGTGHAEVVRVVYDPDAVGYARLLEVFWRSHDPTTKDRQGNDVGPQYRSVVFYHSDRQRDLAERYKKRIDEAGVFGSPVVTEIVPFTEFYPAEEYHQDYFERNPYQPYCRAVVAPKVSKFRKHFLEKLKA